MRTSLLLLAVVLIAVPSTAEVFDEESAFFSRIHTHEDPDEPTWEPTENYSVMKIGGFTVLVSGLALYENPEQTVRALWIIRSQMVYFNNVVKASFERWEGRTEYDPADLTPIYGVRIWLDDSRAGPGERGCEFVCYNAGSKSWMETRNVNPDKHLAITYTDIGLLVNSQRPSDGTLIHELAHAWHHQSIPYGFQNSSIIESYENAKNSGLYTEVMDWFGDMDDTPYAMTDRREFFAVFSESFWTRSSEYPFNFGELKSSDPDSHITINDGWLWFNYGIRTEMTSTTRLSETIRVHRLNRQTGFPRGMAP